MSDYFEQNYPQARSKAKAPSHWPPDVKPISVEGLGLLGLDTKGRIYWDGKPIEVRQRLQLTAVQKVFSVVVALAAVIGGIGSGINNGFEFGCKQSLWTHGCFSDGHTSVLAD